MSKSLKLSVVFILCMASCGCGTLLYTASPISGVVLDESTGQPVAGAVVEAVWYSQSPGYHSPGREIFEVQETVADAQGRYRLSGWKLKLLTRVLASVDGAQPEVSAYKYGYLPRTIRNNSSMDTHSLFIKWNGDTEIKIAPLTGTFAEKVEEFNSYSNQLYWASIYRGCEWKKTIQLLLELDKQLQDSEIYSANMQKNSESMSLISEVVIVPWYLKPYQSASPDCLGAIEILANARELRSKE